MLHAACSRFALCGGNCICVNRMYVVSPRWVWLCYLACILPLFAFFTQFTPLTFLGLDCDLSQRKHANRPVSRRHSLRVRCHHCGEVSSFPLPARPSSRSSKMPEAKRAANKANVAQLGAAAPSGRKGAALSSTKGAVVSSKGAMKSASGSGGVKPSSKPTKQQSTAAASTPGVFGFDFLPL